MGLTIIFQEGMQTYWRKKEVFQKMRRIFNNSGMNHQIMPEFTTQNPMEKFNFSTLAFPELRDLTN